MNQGNKFLQRHKAMKRFNFQIALALAVGLAAQLAHAQTTYEFTNTGPATWYNAANWSNSLVPSSDFGEVGSVDLGRSAFVDTAMANGTFAGQSANPGAVRVGFLASIGTVSTLEIRSGGTFRVQPDPTAVTNGGVTVGAANGSGTLRILPGGAMTADGPLFVDVIATPGNAASRVEVGAATGVGTASFNVGSATVNGVLQTFANSDFNSLGTLSFGGGAVFRPEVKSASNAKVDVTGAATLAGTMTVDFNGFTPTFGSSWTVMEAASLAGNFAAVTSPTLGLGQNLVASTVTIGGGRQQVKVTYSSSLVLTVNRDTGAMALSNPNSPNISLDGYSVRSASGKLDPVSWTSLHDLGALGGDWRESNASANQLAELKPTTSGTISGNGSQTMGNAFNPMASAFAAPEDLVFDYTAPDGSIVNGTVVYSGTRVNNLLMQVDPSNGHAVLKNTSQTTVSIDGYDVASASNSLSTSGWNSLDDQNAAGGDWRESDVSSSHLAELKPQSATSLAPGASFDLGHPFNVGGTQDLAFNFLQGANATATTGVVLYAPIGGAVLGDYNSDGVVDAADFTVWRAHLGQNFALANRNPLNSGVITNADYTYWASRFGLTSGSGSGSLAAGATVPEPASWLLLVTAIAGCIIRKNRNQAS
jgi:hypothetical protein